MYGIVHELSFIRGSLSEVPLTVSPEHKIRVFGQTKTGQVGHYQSSTTRNELMSAQTALKTDQSVHCSDTTLLTNQIAQIHTAI